MRGHSGGLVPPGQDVLPIDLGESRARLGSAGSRGGGPLADPPEGVKPASLAPKHEPGAGDWLPRWVREHVERNTPPAELVDELVTRTLARPNRESLLEAGAVLNELGRNPAHATHVRRAVAKATSELLAEVAD